MDNKRADKGAVFRLSYGLFLLTAKDGDFDNGCINNTFVQQSSEPMRFSVAVNKANLTHDMIKRTGLFNASVLTEQTPFEVFQHFGFQSGRAVNKFIDYNKVARSENGLVYLPSFTNAYFSCRVVQTIDCGSHSLFIAEPLEYGELSDERSATYAYYFSSIKPAPAPQQKRGYICKICGYVHEGDELPEDFICPICKHGAADFEPLK